jgi:preprotein translocase subunit YajC
MKNLISKITLLAMGIMATMGLTSCMPADASGATAGYMGIETIIMMLGLLAVMYFVMWRPSEKKRKQEEQMRESVQIGDELITIGGIKGRVVSIKDDASFILETGPDRTKIQFQKWAISSIITDKPELTANADDKKSKKQKAEEK